MQTTVIQADTNDKKFAKSKISFRLCHYLMVVVSSLFTFI
jgi:hypothetical protein